MWHKAGLSIAAAFVVLVGNPYATRAATVLDQEYTANNGSSAFSNNFNTFRRAQTFTVGVAGILSDIDIFFTGAAGSFTGMNILSTANGVPTTTVVGNGSFQSMSSGVADFTTSLPVTVGEVLAIEPIVAAFSPTWSSNSPGTYSGGQDYFINPSFGINNFTPSGLANNFRTFVTTGAPPEIPLPPAIYLFGSALGGAFWMSRRKRSVGPVSA